MIVAGVKPKMWLSPYCHVITCSEKSSAQTALLQPLGLCAFDFINQYSV